MGPINIPKIDGMERGSNKCYQCLPVSVVLRKSSRTAYCSIGKDINKGFAISLALTLQAEREPARIQDTINFMLKLQFLLKNIKGILLSGISMRLYTNCAKIFQN